jgi:hypothetical protein
MFFFFRHKKILLRLDNIALYFVRYYRITSRVIYTFNSKSNRPLFLIISSLVFGVVNVGPEARWVEPGFNFIKLFDAYLAFNLTELGA